MKRLKQYYTPGLLSLIGLPFLFIFWGPKDPDQSTVIRFNLPSDARDTAGIERFTKSVVYKAIRNKKIITTDLDDYTWDERSRYTTDRKFNFISAEMERLQFTHDTNSVLKVRFGTQSNYSSFVWLINQALVYDFKRYALADNDMYFLVNPPPEIYQYNADDLVGDLYIIPDNKPPSAWNAFKKDALYQWYIFSYWVRNWFKYLFADQHQNQLLAIGFLVLIVLPSLLTIKTFSRYRKARLFHG